MPIIYFAGVPGGGSPGECARELELQTIYSKRLHSYYHLITTKGKLTMPQKVDLFLDSGAFSAFTQKVEINIFDYIDFIKQHEDCFTVYANLDVIGSPEGTWRNQKIMERAGLSPLPCFHYGEDPTWLEKYLSHGYEYLALGGMVPISTPDLTVWLDRIFSKYLCQSDGLPKLKIHGFGLTSLSLMLRYPWYSVDSTSWVMTGRMGSVYIPKFKNGAHQYLQEAWKVCVSTRSPSKGEAGKHIDTFPPRIQQIMMDYLKYKGYELGKSKFKTESENYELKENEKWWGKALNGKREVEILLENGLCNDYRLRDEINIHYFLDLEKAMPIWPWAFRPDHLSNMGGFCL